MAISKGFKIGFDLLHLFFFVKVLITETVLCHVFGDEDSHLNEKNKNS